MNWDTQRGMHLLLGAKSHSEGDRKMLLKGAVTELTPLEIRVQVSIQVFSWLPVRMGDQASSKFKGAGTPISSQMHTFSPRKLTGVFLSTLDLVFITSKAIFIPTLCFIGYTTIFL